MNNTLELSGGNIPACAGKTDWGYMTAWEQYGTSPRARGKRRTLWDQHMGERNIPACAGKTAKCLTAPHLWEEHPRVRGENLIVAVSLWIRVGTSPRARGKLAKVMNWLDEKGNIPACAGKTWAEVSVVMVFPEHPRVRGENQHIDCFEDDSEGTSPRARGKRNADYVADAAYGNIPACAGKT